MTTPYDNHDSGFTRADRKIAANYGVDLDAPAQEKCYSCGKLFEAGELNKGGDCLTCAAEIHAQECAAFVSAPTMAGCKALMGQSVNTTGRAKWLLLLAHEAAIVAAIPALTSHGYTATLKNMEAK